MHLQHTSTHKHTPMHTRTNTHKHAQTRTQTHTHPHTMHVQLTHTHTHTNTLSFTCLLLWFFLRSAICSRLMIIIIFSCFFNWFLFWFFESVWLEKNIILSWFLSQVIGKRQERHTHRERERERESFFSCLCLPAARFVLMLFFSLFLPLVSLFSFYLFTYF